MADCCCSPNGPPAPPEFPVTSVFGRTGDVVAEFGDYTSSLIEDDSGLLAGTPALDDTLTTLATPYRASFFVNPLAVATNLQTGSEQFPYRTMLAATTAAVAAGLTGAVFFLPPETTLVENVVMPAVVTNWEIQCQSGRRATISGTLTLTSTVANVRYQLTNLIVTGLVTGDSPNASTNILYLVNTRLNAAGTTMTLTGTGTGFWFVLAQGLADTGNGLGGSFQAAVNIAGSLLARVYFVGGVVTAGAVQFNDCRYQANALNLTSTVAANNTARFVSTIFAQQCTITGTVTAATVVMDGASASSFMDRGPIFVNPAGAPALFKVLEGNLSADQAVVQAGPFAGTFGSNRQARGLYEVTGSIYVTTGATLGPAAALQTTYEDLGGLATTVTLSQDNGLPMALDVSVAGAKQSGSAIFAHNGDVGITWGFVGVTTPGAAFAATVIVALRRCN